MIAGRSAPSSMSTAFTTPSGSAPQRLEILAFQAFAFGASSAADFHEHVKGHVEHHRPGPARRHGLPGLPHRERHHLAARRLEHLLAHRAHGGGKVGLIVPVHFLERAAVELAGRHVAGHRHERHGIEEGVGERDRQIGRTRAAGREGRGRPARDAVVDVGHEAGDALVMHRDGLDVGGALVQRVDELDVAVAAQAEHLRHLLLDQIVDDDLGAIEHVTRHLCTLSLRLNEFASASCLRGRRRGPNLFLIILYVNCYCGMLSGPRSRTTRGAVAGRATA